ncbi:hypothetical protein FRB90_003503, partial [Tulasnella sp. 427]
MTFLEAIQALMLKQDVMGDVKVIERATVISHGKCRRFLGLLPGSEDEEGGRKLDITTFGFTLIVYAQTKGNPLTRLLYDNVVPWDIKMSPWIRAFVLEDDLYIEEDI